MKTTLMTREVGSCITILVALLLGAPMTYAMSFDTQADVFQKQVDSKPINA